jgi:DNA-binding transcriptional regulator YhcF (GntR family)
MEREGLFHSHRGDGRAVTSDETLINRLRTDEQKAATLRYIDEMTALGVGREQIYAALKEFLTNEENEREENQ